MGRGDRVSLVPVEDYFGEPAKRAAFADLMAEIFGINLAPFDAIAGPDRSSRPFAFFDKTGRCVANLTAFRMPMLIDGRRVHAFGLQSGAVRPEWRRQGLYRAVMDRALAWCEAQGAELVLLYTESPDLYRRAGFRVVAEHEFVGDAPRPHGPFSARPLSLPRDVDLIRRLLGERAPVSQRVAVVEHGAMFLFNALNKPRLALHSLGDDDVIVVSEPAAEGVLRLVDVVGRRIPPLARILGAMGARPARIEVGFPPDQLAWEGTPRRAERPVVLMVRGDMPEAFADLFGLPATAAF